MNIAVLLSGRIVTKDYEKTIKRLKNTFIGYTPIYFLSISETVHNEEFTNKFIKDMNVGGINVEQVEAKKEFFKYPKRPESDYTRVYSMYYHNKKCFDMMEKYSIKKNIKFDIVVKYRSDIDNGVAVKQIIPSITNYYTNNYTDNTDIICVPSLFYKPLINDKLEDNVIYIPNNFDWGGINDQIAYGKVDIMKKYCECVDNIEKICELGMIFHPETLLKTHLLINRLHVKRVDFNYTLIRM
jgi:hypothetical protein